MAGTKQLRQPLIIDRFVKGLVTRRSQLITPFTTLNVVGGGASIVKLFDALIDGLNVELSDNFTLQRRPGFSVFCAQSLGASEVVNQFYSVRNLAGTVTPLVDTNLALYSMNTSVLTSIMAKTSTAQSFVQQVGNITYITDGTDVAKWDGTVVTPWGIAAGTVAPSLQQILKRNSFWSPSTVYYQGQALLDINGNVEYMYQGPGNSALTVPTWSTVLGGKITDNSAKWQMVGGIGRWLPGTIYTQPSTILDTNNNLQLVTAISSTGTSGSTQPSWNTTFGATTSDNQITWTNIGAGLVIAYAGYTYVYCYRTIYGDLSTASPVSKSTGPILSSVPITPINITAYSISSGIGTFTAANTLTQAQQLILNGFPNSTFLNGQVIGVGANPTSTGFTASVSGSDTALTSEAGQANPVITTVNGPFSTSTQCNSTATITNVQVVGGIATITATNNFSVGLSIGLSGLSNAGFLNGQTVVVSSASATQFTCALFGNVIYPTNYASTPDTGTATFLAIEVYRNADGGGIYYFSGAVANPTGTSLSNYSSGAFIAGVGADNGVPGVNVWTNPNNVSSGSSFATVTVPPPSGGSSAFALLQAGTAVHIQAINGNVSPIFTFTNQVTTGNTILVAVLCFHENPPTITDNHGNTYTQITNVTDGQFINYMFISSGVTGGATTVTCTVIGINGSNAYSSINVHELGGVISPSPNNGANVNTGPSSGGLFNTGTIITTNNLDVVFTFMYGLGAVTPVGYTLATNQTYAAAGGTQTVQTAYKTLSTTGTQTPNWRVTTPNGIGISVALKLLIVAPADGLQASVFGFTTPATAAIQGIQVNFEGFYNGGASLASFNVQLMRNGTPVGAVNTVTTATSNTTYNVGGSTNLWGLSWAPADTNNTQFGVMITPVEQAQAGGPFTFSVRNVNILLFGQNSVSTWTYYDAVSDPNLVQQLIAPLAHLNDPPPGAPGSTQTTGGTLLAWWNGRLWMAVGNKLYFNGGPDILNGIPEECWPPANVLNAGGPITGLAPTTQGLIVFTADTMKVVLGGPQTLTFYIEPLLENFGISSPNMLRQDGDQIFVYTTARQFYSFNASGKSEEGQRIGDLLNANFAPATSYLALHRNGQDTGAFIGNGTTNIQRLSLNVDAWSPTYQPVMGAGAINSVETSSGVYSLLLASPTGGGQIFTRNLNVFSDNGTAYPAFFTVGSITLSEPGQPLVPVKHVLGYFANPTGATVPSVSVLFNEIFATGSSIFINLPEAKNEAPLGTDPSLSLLAKRWPVNMNTIKHSQMAHHVQLKVTFSSVSTAKDECLAVGLKFEDED